MLDCVQRFDARLQLFPDTTPDYFEIAIVNEDNVDCGGSEFVASPDEFSPLFIPYSAQAELTHFGPRAYTLRSGRCVAPGSNYHVVIRAVDGGTALTTWVSGGKFTVGEAGCAAQAANGAGGVGVCTTRELCRQRNHQPAASSSCGTLSDVVCCVPEVSDGRTAWFKKQFEFTTPHGDDASIYSTDQLTVEWTTKRSFAEETFDLRMVSRARGNPSYVVARDVSTALGSYSVSSVYPPADTPLGKYDLVAEFNGDSSTAQSFSTPLELLRTPCARRGALRIGSCVPNGACSMATDDNACAGLGQGVTCCYDAARSHSVGFKDGADTLPDTALSVHASLLLVTVCAVFAGLF